MVEKVPILRCQMFCSKHLSETSRATIIQLLKYGASAENGIILCHMWHLFIIDSPIYQPYFFYFDNTFSGDGHIQQHLPQTCASILLQCCQIVDNCIQCLLLSCIPWHSHIPKNNAVPGLCNFWVCDWDTWGD